eukprot:jgi/Undpi1/11205/HiC_scaffold_30.g13503.m1
MLASVVQEGPVLRLPEVHEAPTAPRPLQAKAMQKKNATRDFRSHSALAGDSRQAVQEIDRSMAMEMPPPSPRTEKRRLTGAPEELEVLASPSKRGNSRSRSFFSSSGSDVATRSAPSTPADISWIREQAGTTPRALDRDFFSSSSPASASDQGGSVAAAGKTPAPAPSPAPASNSNSNSASGSGSATSTSATRSKMFNRRTWTKEENEQLQEGMASLGGPGASFTRNEWNAIAHDFLRDSRTGTQCATHWKMVLKPALLKGVWSTEEDAVIYDCVARGVSDWSEVAALLPKRKPKHCRERWNAHLDPTLETEGGGAGREWSAAEEARLVSGVEAHGTNWGLVARLVPGRSESMVQQHWNAIVFRNATSATVVRRGRSGAPSLPTSTAPVTGGSGGGGRARAKPSALPAEPGIPRTGGGGGGGGSGGDLITREGGTVGSGGVSGGGSGRDGGAGAGMMGGGGGPEHGVTLTDREKALMDHAFKTGLSAAKYLHDCRAAMGDHMGDGWGVDDDPALADLYRSLDNIGESLFNEDALELSFDFDSVDKPSPSCGGSGGGGLGVGYSHKMSSKGWDSFSSRQEKEESPFRRAAAQAAATLEQRLSPVRRASQGQSQGQGQGQGQGRELEEACARAAAAAAAAAAAQISGTDAPPSSSRPSSSVVGGGGRGGGGPRVRQGFLRRLFSADTKPPQKSPAMFGTVRGCLSEAHAPPTPPPPPPPCSPSSAARPRSPTGRRGSGSGGGGGSGVGRENRAPRRGQSLFVALFSQQNSGYLAGRGGGSSSSSGGGGGRSGSEKQALTPTLRHGKAEVKLPLPAQLRLPLSQAVAAAGGTGLGGVGGGGGGARCAALVVARQPV